MIREQVNNGTYFTEECVENKIQNVTSNVNNTTSGSASNSTHLPLILVNNGTFNATHNDTLESGNNCTPKHTSDWSLPEVRTQNLGFVDTVFVWFRYIHFTIVPMIIFLIHKVNNFSFHPYS